MTVVMLYAVLRFLRNAPLEPVLLSLPVLRVQELHSG